MILQKNKKRRDCPACGGKKKRMLFQQRFSTISKVSIINGYDVVICQKCGFGFADNIPEQSVLDTYYKEMSKYEYRQSGGRESKYDLARFHKILSTVKRFIPNKQSLVLDIGCSTGRLLSLFKESGYQNVLGLDPSPFCAKAAQELYGVKVLTNNLLNSNFNKLFDLLILVGVLEHIRDVASALAQIRKILADGGLIYIEVPDVSQFARWPNAPFQQFSIEHLNFFSIASLTNLMRLNGFDCLFCRQNSYKWSKMTIDPVISAIYKKSDSYFKTSKTSELDRITEQSLVEYIQYSRETERKIRQKINSIVVSGNSIIVWGAGTHTLRLLATTKLAEAKIRVFVDSNPKYQGKELNGIPIIAPAELKVRKEPILISSYVFQQEIEQQIRKGLKCHNKLILLY